MADRPLIQQHEISAVASIMARKGASAAQIAHALGIEVQANPTWRSVGGVSLIGIGPGMWLAHHESAAAGWIDELREQLDGLASVADQSSAYSFWRVSGPRAWLLLQRGVFLDFHPDSFRSGSVATTVIAHIGVIIRQLDDEPTYELAVFRSYADSFRNWLCQAAAAL